MAEHEDTLGAPVGQRRNPVFYDSLTALNIPAAGNVLTGVTLTDESTSSAGRLNTIQASGTLTNTITATLVEGQFAKVNSAVLVLIDHAEGLARKEEIAAQFRHHFAWMGVGASHQPEAGRVSHLWQLEPRHWDVAQATAFSNVADLRAGKSIDRFRRVLDYLRRLSKTGYGTQLADRLQRLRTDFEEDGDAESNLSFDSVWSLITFLEKNRLKRPTLSSTPSGEIIAQWRGDNALVSVMFLPDGTVRYVAVAPNPNHPELRDRQTGSTTADTLYSAAHFDSLNWAHP